MEAESNKTKIVDLLASKSVCKYKVFDNTYESFKQLKLILADVAAELNEELDKRNTSIPVEYKERDKYEVEFKVAGDLLVFSMHTNVFEFPKAHAVNQTKYVKDDVLRSYCGTISIYNFLSDSFKFNRLNDVGYLIGRIFINNENHFIVEGKRQLGFLFNDLTNQKVEKESLKRIVEAALQYSIEFDLLVPPFDEVKFVSVQAMNQIASSVSLKTGKRLGFRYEAGNSVVK